MALRLEAEAAAPGGGQERLGGRSDVGEEQHVDVTVVVAPEDGTASLPVICPAPGSDAVFSDLSATARPIYAGIGSAPDRERRRSEGRLDGATLLKDRSAMRLQICLIAALACSTLTPATAQQAWPDLTNASSWSLAANRLSIPGLSGTSTNPQYYLGHIYQVSPPYAVSGLRLAFVNWWNPQDGTAPTERCPGNPKSVDFATIFIGGTAYPVTFGGSLSAVIGDCEFVWSDPLRDASGALVTVPAGTTYYIRSSQSVKANQVLTYGGGYYLRPQFTNATLGDGMENTTTLQSAKRLSGTVAVVRNLPSGPAMAIGQGWDGSPVYLIIGDSIGAGQADLGFADSRGLFGYAARALDDSASTRRNFMVLAVPGSRPQYQSTIATGEFKLGLRLLQSIPNRPFNRLFSEMGQNGLGASLPAFQSAMRDWWNFWHGICPTCPVYQTTFMPHAGQVNSSFWTDTSNQNAAGALDQPGGTRDGANAWLRGGPDLPAFLSVIDPAAPVQDTAEPQKWRVLSGSWTSGAAITAAAATLTLAGTTAPTPGDWYVLEPGTANAEIRQAYAVTGSGPWTIALTNTTGKTHPAGAAVRIAPTGDGTHPGTTAHKAAGAAVIARKMDGTLE